MGELVDPNLTTICPVNKPHPRVDLIGASFRHAAGQRAGPERGWQCSLSISVGHAAYLGVAQRLKSWVQPRTWWLVRVQRSMPSVRFPLPNPHPTQHLTQHPNPAVSGSSRSLYAWRPAPAEEEEEDPEGEGSSGKRRGGGDGGGPSRPRVRRWPACSAPHVHFWHPPCDEAHGAAPMATSWRRPPLRAAAGVHAHSSLAKLMQCISCCSPHLRAGLGTFHLL